MLSPFLKLPLYQFLKTLFSLVFLVYICNELLDFSFFLPWPPVVLRLRIHFPARLSVFMTYSHMHNTADRATLSMLFENMCVNYERPIERYRVCEGAGRCIPRVLLTSLYCRAQLMEAAQLSADDVPPLLDEYKVYGYGDLPCITSYRIAHTTLDDTRLPKVKKPTLAHV